LIYLKNFESQIWITYWHGLNKCMSILKACYASRSRTEDNEMIRLGELEGAVGIVERETGMRAEMLPSVLEALVERAMGGDEKSKGGFLRLLPWCGWSLELAYKACGWLAWLYPEHGVRIAEKLIGKNLSG
jgi:hypothetical protein